MRVELVVEEEHYLLGLADFVFVFAVDSYYLGADIGLFDVAVVLAEDSTVVVDNCFGVDVEGSCFEGDNLVALTEEEAEDVVDNC